MGPLSANLSAMKTPTRLVIFVALLLLALTVIGAGVTAVPAPYAALPLGSGLALFLLDFMLVLPWYQDGRRKDRRAQSGAWARKFWVNGGAVYDTPPDPVFPDDVIQIRQPLTEEDAEAFKARWLEEHGKNRGPYPTPPREHWGRYGGDVPRASWRDWDDGQ